MKSALLKSTLFGALSLGIVLQTGVWAEIPIPSSTLYPPLNMGAISQKIPQGVKLNIAFVTPLDSKTAHAGDNFIANVSDDLWAGEELIIPKGTTVRGRVKDVEAPSYFSKGGLMRLSFDHVVMPSGELKPLGLEVDAASAIMDAKRNALYTDPGIGHKLDESLDDGVNQYKKFVNAGVKAGKDMGGGFNMLLTVPTNAIAGVVTGTAVTTYGAGKAIFGKGDSVHIQPGDHLILDFSQPETLPAQ